MALRALVIATVAGQLAVACGGGEAPPSIAESSLTTVTQVASTVSPATDDPGQGSATTDTTTASSPAQTSAAPQETTAPQDTAAPSSTTGPPAPTGEPADLIS